MSSTISRDLSELKVNLSTFSTFVIIEFNICDDRIFCNDFEELQTKLFEVELIINSAPLIYAYPVTIRTCLTPNYLLFGR